MAGDISIEADDKIEDEEKSLIISGDYSQEISASSSLSEKKVDGETQLSNSLPEKPSTPDNSQSKGPTKGDENPKDPKKKRRWLICPILSPGLGLSPT